MSGPAIDVLERHIEPTLRSRTAEEPVVVVHGPRTVGKSTLVTRFARELGTEVLDLDDPPTRSAVAADPALFVSGDTTVIIDEYQHVPQLLDAIKAQLNKDLAPGRFVLTGSTRYGSSPLAAQSLAGRAHVLSLWPLSQGELGGVRETFLSHLLSDPSRLVSAVPSSLTREDYIRRMMVGGFPLAVARQTSQQRARWFRDFVRLVVEKDVLEITKVRQRDRLPRFLARLTAQTGQVLNVAAASDAVGIDKSTGGDYVQLLEAVFLVWRLPAWGRTLGSRVGSLPKMHIGDTGLGAHLLGLTEERLGSRDPALLTEFGHLTETFAVNEIRKQASWLDTHVELGHYRTHDGVEVDVVIEAEDDRVAAIEIKAGSSVSGPDLRGLTHLRDKLGRRFIGGVALHQGVRSYTHDDRIHVAPLDSLWRPV